MAKKSTTPKVTTKKTETPVDTKLDETFEKMDKIVEDNLTKETPVEEKVETPVEEKVETPVEEKVETPIEEKVETPAEEKVETPIEEKVETPIEEKVETPAEEKVETPIEEKVETPIEEMTDIILTEQTLIDNPELAEQGLNVGDTIQVPVNVEMEDVIVTEQMLIDNPLMVEQGIQIGDTIQVEKVNEDDLIDLDDVDFSDESEDEESLEVEDADSVLTPKLKKMFALENYFSNISAGIHLKDVITKEKLTNFYNEFVSLGLMANQNHYDIVKEIKKILSL